MAQDPLTSQPVIEPSFIPGELVELASRITPLQEFVEIHTLNGARRANPYLDAGYKLLGIYQEAEPLATEQNLIVVRKRVTFVLGRTADVEHFDPPSTEKKGKSDRPVQIPSNLAPAD